MPKPRSSSVLRSRGGAAFIAGALIAAVTLLIAVRPWASPPSAPAAVSQVSALAGGPGSAANVDLSSMTPREAADRLFLRVMRAAAANDAVELQSFLPMALGAYDLVDELDAQGNFRVALLQRIGGLETEALATLDAGLTTDPSHLLLLGSAVEISVSLGQMNDARAYALRLIEGFDEERRRRLPEYEENLAVLDNLRRRAEEVLATE